MFFYTSENQFCSNEPPKDLLDTWDVLSFLLHTLFNRRYIFLNGCFSVVMLVFRIFSPVTPTTYPTGVMDLRFYSGEIADLQRVKDPR